MHVFCGFFFKKKYALPFQTLDTLVFYFLRFKAILWTVTLHQCLLLFAQTYRYEINENQRESLLDLLLLQPHSTIMPEIRRELLAGRKEEVHIAPDDGDDTMLI